MIEDMVNRLKKYFEGKENVLLAFILGSAVSGRLTEESDIDIAVLFDGRPEFSGVFKITAEVSEALGRQADIVVLNDSSPVIRMQALKYGKLILGRDKAVYNNFYVKTVKEYDDLKYIRKEAEEKILRGKLYA